MLQIKSYKISLTALAMAAAIAYAPSGNAALANASFETPDASGGDVPGAGAPWVSFNSNFTTSNLRNNIPPGTFYSPDAHSGVQLLKQFGVDAGSFQDLAASEGEEWTASAWAQSWAGDPNNNTGLLQVFFRDANDVNLCDPGGFNACSQSVFDITQPIDTWVQLTASAVAPTGTALARIQLILVPDANTPANGALFWDDASLTSTPAVPVPAAAWLFGSGLLGLVGVARRVNRS